MHNKWLYSRFLRAAAFIFVPLLFSITGMGMLYFGAYDMVVMARTLAKMAIAQSAPDFQSDIKSMFQEEDAEIIAAAIADKYGDGNTKEDGQVSYLPLSEFVYPTVNSRIGILSCERLGMNAALYFGTSQDVMMNGVGIEYFCRPIGFETTVLVGGHRQLDFVLLQYAEIGDEFTVLTYYGKYTYRVTEIKVVKKAELDSMNLQTNEERLILFTCYPFMDTLARKVDRYLVICEKVSGLPIR